MENGEIKEQGSHEELMEKRSLYYSLVTNQIFADENDACSSEEGIFVNKNINFELFSACMV